ncbi:MAG: LysE family translocator [Saprospiraceae bacterium]|nr:MAG: LysE family translocator [Saprospiraceae bacterium]
MDLLWNGIKFGLALSILVGPILFALIQTSIEEGFRAGWTVGLGIWMSDMCFITLTYFGVSYIAELLRWDGLEFTLGIAGGIILLVFGIGALLVKPPAIDKFETKAVRHHSYFALWFRGYLINSVNPFTFFFWIGVSGMLFTERGLQPHEARWFYGGLVGTLMVSDTVKVALAKFIRRWLKPNFILWLRRIAGIALIVFGVVLLVRASAF